ncbi:MAG: hypothetical protein IKJ33_01940 [Clostridia bacterium]|nr:hypothetical protein [Clostridia bacterium]
MLVKQKQIKQNNLSNYLKNLNEEQKFKLWIKTILSAQNNLPEIIKSIDKIIEIKASSLSFISDIYNTEKSTQSQVERVIDLTERKNKLLNIYLISKKLVDSLNEDDRLYLQRKYIFNWTAEELSQEYQISIRTAFRRTEKLIDQIYEKIKRSNWSLKFITNQVNGEVWLIEKFNRYAKDSMPNNFSYEQNIKQPENE